MDMNMRPHEREVLSLELEWGNDFSPVVTARVRNLGQNDDHGTGNPVLVAAMNEISVLRFESARFTANGVDYSSPIITKEPA